MENKQNTEKMFENYLQEVHAKNYHGSDDDMPDAFEDWLVDLDKDELIELAEKALQSAHEEEVREVIEKYKEALIWCSGAEDFQYPDGKARVGWEKIVQPLLKKE